MLKTIAKLDTSKKSIAIVNLSFYYLEKESKLWIKQQFDFRSTITILKRDIKIIKLIDIDANTKECIN